MSRKFPNLSGGKDEKDDVLGGLLDRLTGDRRNVEKVGQMPWVPFISSFFTFFAARFGKRIFGGGGSGGCLRMAAGCLILFCLAGVVLGYGAVNGVRALLNRDNATQSAVTPGPVIVVVKPTAPGLLATLPGNVVTTAMLNLSQLHALFDNLIPVWQSQLAPNQLFTMGPQELGLSAGGLIRQISYGKCGDGLFVYAILNSLPSASGFADMHGYAYTPSGLPITCHPPGWNIYDSQVLGDFWNYVVIQSQNGAK